MRISRVLAVAAVAWLGAAARAAETGAEAEADALVSNLACPGSLQPCQWARPKMVEPGALSSEESSSSGGGSEAGGVQVQDVPFNPAADPNMPQVTTVTRAAKNGRTVTTTHTRIPLPQANAAAALSEESSAAKPGESSLPLPAPGESSLPLPKSEESSSLLPKAEESSSLPLPLPRSEESSEESSGPKKRGSGKLKINSVVEISIGGKPKPRK